MTSLERFIGIPWKVGGRTFDGVDCGGLCMLASKHLFGVELPDKWSYNETNNLEMSEDIYKDFKEMSIEVSKYEAQDGDIVIFKLRNGHVHFGLFVNGMMLHIADNKKSQLSRLPVYAEFRRYKGGEA